ncbi:unnamed protein product, partial [Scytosiphon promiscuus]
MCTRREPHPVLRSVTPEVFEELGNMGQAPTQHEMLVETTLEKRGATDARINTGGDTHCR